MYIMIYYFLFHQILSSRTLHFHITDMLTLSFGFKVPSTVEAASLAIDMRVLPPCLLLMDPDWSIIIITSLGVGVAVSTYHGLNMKDYLHINMYIIAYVIHSFIIL